jgi:glycyl-tRNA synthetase beta chain
MRTNQKYFACTDKEGRLAPNFVCTANIDSVDGGAAIVAGNERVLSARLSDAKFFWEQDLKVPLEEQAGKLVDIVFHEKLGTVADKAERVARLARWLVEEGIVGEPRHSRESGNPASSSFSDPASASAAQKEQRDSRVRGNDGLADLADRAARLCKADLVTQMVGEFPELQGLIGGHLARAQGEDPQVADAIRDHYKPVGQGDEVPTAPVTVAVSLADKLDTLISFFGVGEWPTGSRDPFALRRAALGVINLLQLNNVRLALASCIHHAVEAQISSWNSDYRYVYAVDEFVDVTPRNVLHNDLTDAASLYEVPSWDTFYRREIDYGYLLALNVKYGTDSHDETIEELKNRTAFRIPDAELTRVHLVPFFADRLKIQQREAGVRHDLIDAVFALGGEDDLVRLLARVRALQAFVETPEGADLLAGYKRAANILRKEGWDAQRFPAKAGAQSESGLDPGLRREAEQAKNKPLPYTPEKEEDALIAALDSAEPRARAAVEAEDFEGAMAALASLRAPVDSFFDKVTVNDPDPAKREARLGLLARMRDAVHRVADFSRIEG